MLIAEASSGNIYKVTQKGTDNYYAMRDGIVVPISGDVSFFEELEKLVKSISLKTTDLKIITKSSEPNKFVTTAVVMSPYRVDGHDDYASPAEIRKAAREYSKSGMKVDIQHKYKTDSVVVENYTERYPTGKDEAAAMSGKPHKAFKFIYDDGDIHSGDWVTKHEHSPETFNAIQKGVLTGLSPELWASKKDVGEATLPQVTFEEIDMRSK